MLILSSQLMAGITGTKQHTWILFLVFVFYTSLSFPKLTLWKSQLLQKRRGRGSGVRTVPGAFLSESQVAEILLYRPGKNRAGVS